MKFSIDVECTPEEVRAFLGLPDVKGLQERIMAETEERMRAGLAGMEPEKLFKMWMPGGMQGWEEIQKRFWEQFMGGGKR